MSNNAMDDRWNARKRKTKTRDFFWFTVEFLKKPLKAYHLYGFISMFWAVDTEIMKQFSKIYGQIPTFSLSSHIYRITDKLVSAVSLNTIRVMFKILWWISASAGSTGFLIVSVAIINACEFTWSSHVLISWYKIRQFTIRLTWPIFTRHNRPTYRSRLKMHEWIETVHSSATLQMAQIRQRCKTK